MMAVRPSVGSLPLQVRNMYISPVSSAHEQTQDAAKQRIRIKIRAYDHKIIDQATDTIIKTAERTDAKVLGPVPLPTDKRKYTTNRSTFVHKTSSDQFEIRIHKRLIDILNPTDRTIDALMSLNLPAGVDVEIKM